MDILQLDQELVTCFIIPLSSFSLISADIASVSSRESYRPYPWVDFSLKEVEWHNNLDTYRCLQTHSFEKVAYPEEKLTCVKVDGSEPGQTGNARNKRNPSESSSFMNRQCKGNVVYTRATFSAQDCWNMEGPGNKSPHCGELARLRCIV